MKLFNSYSNIIPLIFFALALTLLSFSAFAQHKIMGKVTSNDGKSMQGVRVFTPNAKYEAFTDIHGIYEINIPRNIEFLHYDFIGMKLVIERIDNRDVINIILQKELVKDPFEVLTSVASVAAKPVREQPGIVSVITEAEIASSGARDLLDVLRLVPGFDFALDVFSHAGLAVRGIWSMEGKMLVRIDGRQVNDSSWGNILFQNNIPVDNIKQIEIIRGPGSAKYGSFAELAVVNITTKGAELNGISATTLYGRMSRGTIGRTSFNVNAGKQFENGGISLDFYNTQGNMSDGVYEDFNGKTWDMADNSRFVSQGFNIGANYKGLDFRLMGDRHYHEMESLYGFVQDSLFSEDSPAIFVSLEYDLKVNNKLTITPRISRLSQAEHLLKVERSYTDNSRGTFYHNIGQRTIVRLSGIYNVKENLNILFGVENNRIGGNIKALGSAWAFSPREGATQSDYFRGNSSLFYNDRSVFFQGEFFHDFINITAGLRYDKHSGIEGNSLVPRLALTKVFDKFHIKALYSEAYKVGDLEHINLASIPLVPEKLRILEFEAGYQWNKNVLLTANIFDLVLDNPIIYLTNGTTRNGEQLASRGFEVEFKTKGSWGFFDINYSYYQASSDRAVNYQTVSNPNVYLGIPASKLAFNSSFKLHERFYISPTAYFISKRYGVNRATNSESPRETIHDPELLLNVFGHYQVNDGLTASLGVYDLLGANYEYVQAYDSPFAPLPGPSREIMLRLSYKISNGE